MTEVEKSNAEEGLLKRASRIAKKIQGEPGCSMPGTHDRIEECGYFFGRMLETYHSPNEFRWNLHAFVQAIKSFVLIGYIESQNDPAFVGFRKAQETLKAFPDWQKLSKLRDEIAHKEPLLANSSVMIGMFSGTRMKMAFHIPIPTHTPSWLAIARSRNDTTFVSLHREGSGEQIGLVREWRLPRFDRELAEVCYDILDQCGKVMQAAPGHKTLTGACTGLDIGPHRLMLEHQLFPEVSVACVWDFASPSIVNAIKETEITSLPGGDGDRLHRIQAGTSVEAWLGDGKNWGNGYSSLLIARIGGKEIDKDTAGFYLRSAFTKPSPTENANREDRP
jgi:hypothetical protein